MKNQGGKVATGGCNAPQASGQGDKRENGAPSVRTALDQGGSGARYRCLCECSGAVEALSSASVESDPEGAGDGNDNIEGSYRGARN